MPHAWFVTFEVDKRGRLPKRRNPRVTRTFATEAEAKQFASAKFHEGLVVFAGTINPYLPRQLIPSASIPSWLGDPQDQEPGESDDAHTKDK